MNLKGLILEALNDAERQKIIDNVINYKGKFNPNINTLEDFLKKNYPNLTLTPDEIGKIKSERRRNVKKRHRLKVKDEPSHIEKRKIQQKNSYIKRRNDTESRLKDNARILANQKKLKENPDYIDRSNLLARNRYKEKSKDPEFKSKHNTRKRSERTKRRTEDPNYRLKRNTYQRSYFKNRMKIDPEFALKVSCRRRFNDFVNSRGKISFSKYVDLDYEKLKNHLERLFKPGMSWENRGKWHIDHIRPLSSFKYFNDDGSINTKDVVNSWRIENMQPLWDIENLTKGSTYDPQGEEHFELEPKDFPNDIPDEV
jgi:hypothetical protein